MEIKSTKTKVERLTKINKDRRHLTKLLHKLRLQIEFLLANRENNKVELDVLFKRRKDYRKRLTKLTEKRRRTRKEKVDSSIEHDLETIDMEVK